MRGRSGLVIVAVACVACGGCMTIDNDRLSIGPVEEARESAADVVVLPAISRGPTLGQASGPSLDGLDRSGWEEIVFVAPNDGTAHWPHFTRRAPAYDGATSRARGEHPTALTALETGGSCWSQVGEAVAWPVYGVGDFFLAIPRVVDFDGQSPTEGYERGRPAAKISPAGL